MQMCGSSARFAGIYSAAALALMIYGVDGIFAIMLAVPATFMMKRMPGLMVTIILVGLCLSILCGGISPKKFFITGVVFMYMTGIE